MKEQGLRLDAKNSVHCPAWRITYIVGFYHMCGSLGLIAAASNLIPVGLLFMRPPQWCSKTNVFFPKRQLILHDYANMFARLENVEEALVLAQCWGTIVSTLLLQCLTHELGHGEWEGCYLFWLINCLINS